MFISRRGFAFLGAAALASSFVLSSCGGGGGKKVDPEDWVAEFCDLVIEFEDDANRGSEVLFEIDFADKSAKDDVVDFLEEQKDLLADFEKEFDKIGQPDSKNGGKIRDAAKANFADNKKAISDFIREVKKLDTGKDFEDDFADVANDIEEPDGFRERLEDINASDADDIIDFIDEDSECAPAAFDE